MTLHWQKVKYYVLHTQMISILLYLTAKPLLHASQPDKIIGTTRSTPGQSVFDNVCFVPDSKRNSDKFKRCFEELARYGSLDSMRKSFAIQIDSNDFHMGFKDSTVL